MDFTLADLHKDLMEIKFVMKLMMPSEFTIGYIAKQSGRSRQAVRDYITKNLEPDVDFHIKDGKIYVGADVAMKYILERKNI